MLFSMKLGKYSSYFWKETIVLFLISLSYGILAMLALEPFAWPGLGWLVPWPLFYMAQRYIKQTWTLILAGLTLMMALCGCAFYWLFELFKNFYDFQPEVSGFVFLLTSILINLKTPLLLACFYFWERSPILQKLLPSWFYSGSLGVSVDALPNLFPWSFGNLIASQDDLVQIIEFTGVSGLAFLMFAGSRLLYENFQTLVRAKLRFSSLRPRFSASWLFIVLIISIIFWGNTRKLELEEQQRQASHLRVAILQPNTPLGKNEERDRLESMLERWMTHTIPELLTQAQNASNQTLELVVLPESAIPFYSTQKTSLTQSWSLYHPLFAHLIQTLSQTAQADVLYNEITAQIQWIEGHSQPFAYNSAVLFHPQYQREVIYHKRLLLPFGEYLPGLEILQSLGVMHWLPEVMRGGRFYPGEEATLFPYRTKAKSLAHLDRKFAVLICYEALHAELVRDFFHQSQSPDFLINLTQDGWYGATIQPAQHYELARLRAIETRRVLVRATNTGISGFIDWNGHPAQPTWGERQSKPFTKAFQIWDIPLAQGEPTFYVRYGNLWQLALVALGLSLIIWRWKNQDAATL